MVVVLERGGGCFCVLVSWLWLKGWCACGYCFLYIFLSLHTFLHTGNGIAFCILTLPLSLFHLLPYIITTSPRSFPLRQHHLFFHHSIRLLYHYPSLIHPFFSFDFLKALPHLFSSPLRFQLSFYHFSSPSVSNTIHATVSFGLSLTLTCLRLPFVTISLRPLPFHSFAHCIIHGFSYLPTNSSPFLVYHSSHHSFQPHCSLHGFIPLLIYKPTFFTAVSLHRSHQPHTNTTRSTT